MGKRNTLLYLDSDIVQLAKKFDLNMSEIAENAIKTRVVTHLSSGERALVFDAYLEDLERRHECYVLPFAVKSIRLKNVRAVEELSARFELGANLVHGKIATGKTTVISLIAGAAGEPAWPIPTLSRGKTQMELEIEFFPQAPRGRGRGECILLDEPLGYVSDPDGRHKERFVKWLGKKYGQVIIASHDEGFIKAGCRNVTRLGTPAHDSIPVGVRAKQTGGGKGR